MNLDMSFCSGPFWPDVCSIRNEATGLLVRQSALMLMGHPVVTARAPKLAAALSELCNTETFSRPTWTPSVGRVQEDVIKTLSDRALWAAAALVFDFVEHVSPFSVDLRFEAPLRLVADPVVLPASTHIQAHWDGETLTVGTPAPAAEVRGGHPRMTFFLAPWSQQASSTLVSAGDFVVLDHARHQLFSELGVSLPEREFPAMCEELRTAGNLLRTFAPEYLKWVRPMVRWVVPLATPPGGYASGGGQHLPGIIAVSGCCPPITLAESIVHEAAHQYLFLVTSFGRIAVPDGRLYHSPLAKRQRPLERVVFAFHAAANIAILYQLVAGRDATSAPLPEEIERNTDDCRELAGHVAGNPALTDLGRFIVDPILGLLYARNIL